MKITAANRREAFILFAGDLVVFLVSLWFTLAIRYVAIPSEELFMSHLVPFSFLFAVWIGVYFIAGLYDKHTRIFREYLPATIFNAQLINVLLAALFFFAIPYFGITPKTNLLIYLGVSFLLIVAWRLTVFEAIERFVEVGIREKALLIGAGKEIEELKLEINHNHRYPFEFAYHFAPREVEESLDLQGKLLELISSGEATVIVGDPHSPALAPLVPLLSNLAFLEVKFTFIDSTVLYEAIFDRVPLSLIRSSWFLENISTSPKHLYHFVKRLVDMVGGCILGVITLAMLPFVALAIKLDDGGSIFFASERVGKDNRPFRFLKFRSMSQMEREKVTRVGYWIRKLRFDEFPQSWNLIKGDLSLIGPRPEIPRLVQQYAERIPNYNVRHLIKPGVSGWAQIKEYDAPKGGIVDMERTSTKLSYDLYYIKHHSILLDLLIALKTVKTLLARSGS
jgi:lipopolysaccharide/colanic/teichoic acid biosynthesis glycosyltransferase